MTTIEGNKLIAEFMGADIDNGHYKVVDFYKNDEGEQVSNFVQGKCYFYNNDEIEKVVMVYDLEYHTSWDWLMPVVEKIEQHGCIVELWLCLGKGCRIIKGNFKEPVITIANTESNSTIEAVWQAVVEFIQWYNQKSQSNE